MSDSTAYGCVPGDVNRRQASDVCICCGTSLAIWLHHNPRSADQPQKCVRCACGQKGYAASEEVMAMNDSTG